MTQDVNGSSVKIACSNASNCLVFLKFFSKPFNAFSVNLKSLST